MADSIFESPFIFATCRPGAEFVVKEEFARDSRGFHFAFSRPGFLTFKSVAAPLSADSAYPASFFSRAQGLVVGKATAEHPSAIAASIWTLPSVRRVFDAHRIAALHVWQRIDSPMVADRNVVGGSDDVDDARATLVESAPTEWQVSNALKGGAPAPRGCTVLDVILVEPNEWWVGLHRADQWIARWPGGAVAAPIPEDVISRAYGKMVEALAWSRLPIQPEDCCIELGCAPGGASEALLGRGLRVIGVDPAEVDAKLRSHPNFTHVRKRAADIRKRTLREVDWLVADMNVAPQYTLDAVESIVTNDAVHVRGMVLTLKLFEWRLASQLPEFIERVRSWGFRDVRARQLVSGGQEVCMVALKSRAARRRSPNRSSATRNATNAPD